MEKDKWNLIHKKQNGLEQLKNEKSSTIPSANDELKLIIYYKNKRVSLVMNNNPTKKTKSSTDQYNLWIFLPERRL